MAVLTDVEIAFSEESRGRVEIRAREGSVHLDSEDFWLSGGVEGTTAMGDRFATEDLVYDRSQQRLWTASRVRLDRANLTLEADGMEFDVEERRIRLTGEVEVVMAGSEPSEGGGLR